jgi:hypothetical protein
MSRLDPKLLEAAATALITSRETNLGVEVSLPVIYPNGQAVSVTITLQRDRYIIHDSGAGAMYLTSLGLKLDKRLRERLSEYAKSYGCEFLSGRVTTTCTVDQLAVAMALVANASRAVGDEGRIRDTLLEASFDGMVSDMLRDIVGRRLREKESIVANSGKAYQVGHVILDATLSRPAAFIESVPKPDTVPRRVTEFFDLMDEYPDVAREAVYDDKLDWGPHNLVLLHRVANPVPFGQAQERIRVLAA